FEARAGGGGGVGGCRGAACPARQGGGLLPHHQARALAATSTEIAKQSWRDSFKGLLTGMGKKTPPGRSRRPGALQTQALAVLLARSRQIKWLRNTYRTYSVCS